MDYAVFTPEEEIVDPKVIFFSPKEGDPDDYVAIELASGKRITITNTCAANVLGLISPDNFAYGNANAARKAMQPLADYMGKTVEEVATQILTRAYEKIEPVITELAAKPSDPAPQDAERKKNVAGQAASCAHNGFSRTAAVLSTSRPPFLMPSTKE